MLAPSAKTRHLGHLPLPIPDFHLVHRQPCFHHFADQPAGHRVHVAIHVDQAAGIDLDSFPLGRLHAPLRKLTHHRHLFGKPLAAACVQPRKQRLQEATIRIQTGEVATAAQHQFLIYGSLEAMMALFDIAVLVAMSGLDLLRRQTVVAQQTFIAVGELRRPHRVVDRRRQPVRPVPLRHLAQLPQGILQAFAQALEALREAHRSRFPVRVRQHEVIDQVRKTLPLDGHAQLFHVREVRGAQTTGMMLLREEHLARWTFRRAPLLHLPLQRAQLSILKTPRMDPLKMLEHRLGFKTRVGLQKPPNGFPHRAKRIGPCTPTWPRLQLARQTAYTPILPRCLRVHPRLGRRQLKISFTLYQRK